MIAVEHKYPFIRCHKPAVIEVAIQVHIAGYGHEDIFSLFQYFAKLPFECFWQFLLGTYSLLR